MPLTEQIIEAVETHTTSSRLNDGNGLYLLVNPNGSKWWRYDFRFEGKRKTLSMGVYPDTSLSAAREAKDKAIKLLSEGINPSGRIRTKKPRKVTESKRQCDTRFLVDDKGALSFKLGRRSVKLNLIETMELRAFLKATEGINPAACTNHNSEPGAQDQTLAPPLSQDAQPPLQLQNKSEKTKEIYITNGTWGEQFEVRKSRKIRKPSL
jgi:hypothetical protein